MSAVAIVEAYASRWTVEPLLAALKPSDGLGAMWQRGRTALLRWLHLVQIGRALLVLLTARAEPQTLALLRVGGWRRLAPNRDADAGSGQGGAHPSVPRLRGLPPRAHDTPQIGAGPWHRATRLRRRGMSTARTPSLPASNRYGQPDQTTAVGGARRDELETPVRQ